MFNGEKKKSSDNSKQWMKMFRYENLIEFYVDYARIDGIEYVRILKKNRTQGKEC